MEILKLIGHYLVQTIIWLIVAILTFNAMLQASTLTPGGLFLGSIIGALAALTGLTNILKQKLVRLIYYLELGAQEDA